MVNYPSTIQGSLGVPLSYVVRENDKPIPEGHDNFIEKCVACAPLKGTIFEADSRRVHQVISANVHCEAAKQWIKFIKRKKNRRANMIVLRANSSREVNSSRRIVESEQLRDLIHYKNERYM